MMALCNLTEFLQSVHDVSMLLLDCAHDGAWPVAMHATAACLGLPPPCHENYGL